MTETTMRRRVEVLADEPLIPAIERIAASAGIEHYTMLPTLGGMGHAGRWRNDQISEATAKVMFMAITSQEGADRLAEMLSPLLATHHLMLLISTVEVIRGQHFD